MGRRSFPGGIISSTEPSVTGYGASGMWTTQTAAQKKNSGFWPIRGITPSGPLVGPTIGNVSVTDSSYNVLNDTPYIDSAGGYIRVTGTGFASGAVVYVGGSAAVTTSFINSTEVRAQIGAGSTSNAFPVYVVNSDSSVAIKLAAVTYSGSPSWSTSAALTDLATDTSFSVSLSAISDSSITYSLAAGSSLPPGTSLSSGGVFSGTISSISVTVDTVYSFSVVANDAENQDASRTFTVTVTVGDPFYYLTPLLLNGEATTWITDASANKLLPTISGDSKPSSFSPYNTSWGAYFDGTGDYLTFPANADFAFGTGDFTVEAWVYPTANQVASASILANSSNPNGWYLFFNTSPAVNHVCFANFSTIAITSSSPVPLGAWTHVAVARSGTALAMYFNGVSVGSATNSTTYGDAAATNYIGSNGSTAYVTGYISNARVVKSLAVYTGAFTPPSTILGNTQSSGTNISAITAGSSLLTLQDSRFKDNGKNALTITQFGDAAVKSMGPFVDTDTVTGSGYFDGTGDYLTIPTSSIFTFPGDFTIECWVYSGSSASVGGAYPTMFATSAFNSTGIGIKIQSAGGSGTTGVACVWNNSTQILTGTTVIANSGWHHVAVSRVGTSMRLFVNGLAEQTITNSTTFTVAAGYPLIAADTTSTGTMIGYVNDVRVVKGLGVYTGNFTPPTTTLGNTQISGSNISAITSGSTFLTLQYRQGENNHRFIDDSGSKNIMLRAGNATQGTFSPFSPAGWSAYFGGAGNYIVTNSAAFASTQSTFTIECWMYMTSTPTGTTLVGDQSPTAGTIYWGFSPNTSRILTFYWYDGSPKSATGSTTMALNTWYHIAVSVNANAISLFVNGAVETVTGTTVLTNRSGSVGYISMAQCNTGGSSGLWTGYVSNLSILAGTAKYSGAFTPATSSLSTSTTNQVFLFGHANRLIDLNIATTAKTITVTGTVSVQAFSPFKPSAIYNPTLHGGSAYFDGSGDAVYNTTAPVTNFGTGDFTVDYWVYQTVATGSGVYVQHLGSAATANGLAFGCAGTGNGLYATTVNVGIGANVSVPLNQWNHIAWTRQNGLLRGYLNGAVAYSASFTTSITELSTSVGAASNGGSNASTSWLSDIRVLKGNALYTTSTFTVPTSPSALTANVALKLNFTNGGMIDAASRNSFETLGDVKIVSTPTKFGSGALYFDGTGDYLKFQPLPIYTFGTGDFTFECWIYMNSYNATWGSQIFGGHVYGVSADYLWSINTTGKMVFQITSSTAGQIVATSSVPLTTWTHIALVRYNGTVTPYINGTSAGGAASYTTAMTIVTSPTIGTDSTGNAGALLNGYIDDFRISRYARYTGAFTAPTSAFQTK